MSFPHYPEYKDSGVKWLGKVPGHWGVKPVKALASCNDEVLEESTDADYEIEYIEISGVDAGRGITQSDAILFANAPSRARRRVQDGDVIVSTVRTYLRSIAQVVNPPANMVVSTGFAVIRPRSVVSAYLGYLFQTEFVIAEVIARSVGVSYPAINASELMRLHVPIPEAAEQTAIAAFLDHETAKIDALVAEQEKLIALLKEKRQAVISRAVTKGLNPDAPMKDSGIGWLGEVPAHWEVCHLKRMTSLITDGAHISPETDGGVFDFVSTKDVAGDFIDFEGALKTSPESYEYLVRTGCKPLGGDVLFSKDGTIGRTVVVEEDRDFVVASSLIIIRPAGELLMSHFLNYLCQSDFVRQQVDRFVKGAGLPRLSIQNLLKVVGVFPTLSEQGEIVSFLGQQIASFDLMIAEADAGIALLKERRSALISAAVTGKIDVRGFVAEKEAA